METGRYTNIKSIPDSSNSMKLKIAILGTRDIPNHYGGFEHISEYVSEGLVKRGYSVTVYNSHNHPKEDYFLLMARMEPKNNIETILEGFNNSNSHKTFKVLGDTSNRFGKFITHKFKNYERIQFKGAIFDTAKVRALQNNSYLYFHGHSVGGTNLSLLEAMASKALIAAHNNPFNKSVLNSDAFYFSNAGEVQNIVENVQRKETEKTMVTNNLHKIKYQFNWEKIIGQYEAFILESYYQSNYAPIVCY